MGQGSVKSVREFMTEMQRNEVYIYFFAQMLHEFVYDFIESPRKAVVNLAGKVPGAEEKLAWVMDFERPVSKTQPVEVAVFADKEKRLFRAAKDVVALISEFLRQFQEYVTHEIEVLLHYRGGNQSAGRQVD